MTLSAVFGSHKSIILKKSFFDFLTASFRAGKGIQKPLKQNFGTNCFVKNTKTFSTKILEPHQQKR